MWRLPANAKRCFRGALTLATFVSAVLLACLAAARVWMIGPPEGEYAISMTDQLHVLFLWLFGLKIELPHWHRGHRIVMGGG